MRHASGSLRRRLLAILVGLMLGGLLVADLVTYAALKSFLVHHVDEQLAPTAALVARALNDNGGRLDALGSPEQLHQMLPASTFVQVRDAGGAIVGSVLARAPGSAPGPSGRLTTYRPRRPHPVCPPDTRGGS
jgi:hypothetical protein